MIWGSVKFLHLINTAHMLATDKIKKSYELGNILFSFLMFNKSIRGN